MPRSLIMLNLIFMGREGEPLGGQRQHGVSFTVFGFAFCFKTQIFSSSHIPNLPHFLPTWLNNLQKKPLLLFIAQIVISACFDFN